MVKISDNYPELIRVGKWKVKSRTSDKVYLVEQMGDGSFRCSCPAYKPICWHINFIREKVVRERLNHE